MDADDGSERDVWGRERGRRGREDREREAGEDGKGIRAGERAGYMYRKGDGKGPNDEIWAAAEEFAATREGEELGDIEPPDGSRRVR